MPSNYDLDRQNESDILKIAPKLKGDSNFAQWQHRLYMALKENNKICIEIIHGIVQQPPPPDLYKSIEVIREFAMHQVVSTASASGLKDPTSTVTDNVVRELVKERKRENAEISVKHQIVHHKWDLVNTRCCNLIISTLDIVPTSYR
ncbi:hypothetical protein N7519_007947 [Penicillium mononematosum]|uniref:uncharacterized protein n=1 Tax=Penicillium mononematosum TaxID=268346 RepID=UPI0025493F50|nr:uncharacterized protein N7519_007947 [Penicillium mononematosum]KAJ6186646.1 hypothetical protein N7519_007947 [Penicillium mononematosum]